jgi:copper chaperone CopZ
MMCNHCKANVEKNLSKVKGVSGVQVNLSEGIAYIEGDGYAPEEIINTINSLGYRYIGEE